VARWTVEVIERIDHDPMAFTQGLEVVDGVGYESTGRRGESTVRRFDPTTGEVTMSVPLADAVFAEGLTLIDNRLVQLTYTSGIAYVRSPDDLEVVDTFTYEGEGWGICAPGDDTLWLSDGTTTLRRLDGEGDRVIESVDVQGAGVTVGQLNELECVAGHVLANMWGRDDIAVIDPDAGRVVAVIDASALADEVAPAVASDDQNVLNGIAALDDGTLLLTGKRWPTLFRVRLVAD
jgi:glutaminyl-peptide cyclotransferase